MFSLVNNLCLITGVMGSIQIIFAAYCVVLCVLQMLVLSSGMNLSLTLMSLTNVKYPRKIEVE
jgi:hypothetical protein